LIGKTKSIIILILLWLSLSVIFAFWGSYSLSLLLDVPSWPNDLPEIATILPIIHFGVTISTIVWFVFAGFFIVFSYGTFKKDHWVWTTGIIFSTIFLVVFSLMLASFIINALLFLSEFSVLGLVTVVLAFIADLGIIFYLTRPATRMYFEVT
jgi:hypothetical protein